MQFLFGTAFLMVVVRLAFKSLGVAMVLSELPGALFGRFILHTKYRWIFEADL